MKSQRYSTLESLKDYVKIVCADEALTKYLNIEKEVIAFLNYHECGINSIGIDKDGSVITVEDVDSDLLKIKDRLKNNIQPSCLGLFDVKSEKVVRNT